MYCFNYSYKFFIIFVDNGKLLYHISSICDMIKRTTELLLTWKEIYTTCITFLLYYPSMYYTFIYRWMLLLFLKWDHQTDKFYGKWQDIKFQSNMVVILKQWGCYNLLKKENNYRYVGDWINYKYSLRCCASEIVSLFYNAKVSFYCPSYIYY